MMKKTLLFLLLLPLFSQLFATTYTFDDWSDFKDAITGKNSAPQPGDEFILKDGVYSNNSSASIREFDGTAEAPIIIRAENIGGVTFDNAIMFDVRSCSYMVFQGFNFELTTKSNIFKLQACNNVRITQCVLDGATETVFDSGGDREDSDWISIQGLYDDYVTLSHNNQVDHNVFKNKMTLGNIIKIDGTNQLWVSQYDVIEYNYFKNVGPRADNEMETIRVGWSAMSESDGFCTIANNLFEECDGDPEIISIKCNKNTIKHNTFRRCAGTLSLRHGNESVIDGNFFLGENYTDVAVDSFPDSGGNGSGGIRLYGSDHKIINNYFEGLTGTKWDAPITLTYGDAEDGGGLSLHWRIDRAIIANNTLINNLYGIEIGYENNGKYDLPPRDVVMAYNIVSDSTNSLVNYRNAPTNMQWINNIMYPTGTAVVGEGSTFTDFTSAQAQEINPQLVMGSTHYEAGASTPTFTPNTSIVGNILTDIDGQTRTTPTNYGADQYITNEAVTNTPLNPSDVGPATGDYLYISTVNVSAARIGDSINISVSSNVNWDVKTTADWISFNTTSGSTDGTFTIIVAENTTSSKRTATVEVNSTNASDGVISNTIEVTQEAVDTPILTLSTSMMNFSSNAQVSDVTITSNLDWTATASEEWININPASGSGSASISVSIEENTLSKERTANIVVSDGGSNSKTIALTQAGFVGDEFKLPIISVLASTEQTPDNIADNVFDGDLTNRWSAEGDSVTIDLNLDSVYIVSYLKLGLFKGNERVSFFDILASEDGINFTEVLMGQSTTISTDDYETIDFDDINAQYIRFVGRGTSTDAVPDINNPTGLWNSYTELEVWGKNLGTANNIKVQASRFIKVYPNPNNGTFSIKAPVSSQVVIYNLTGSVVYNKISTTDITNINSLKSGLYFISVKTNNETKVSKVIVE